MRVSATVHRDFRIATIDDRIYSAFIEHLGRAIYSGIYEPGHPEADDLGFRKDVLGLVRDLKVPVIRYPGGNFVSAYDWKDGIGPREDRPMRLDLAWRTKESNQIGVNEFAQWCERAGIQLMLAANLGTGTLQDAREYIEYVNHPGGTAWSDLRRSHGYEKPHGVKMWCLGNEMDGPWQIGHRTAHDYGRIADETAKALKGFDPTIETIACGSSNDEMATYPDWERIVLEECYENVNYVSLHKYFGNRSHDTLNFLAKVDVMGRYIKTVGGIIDYVKAKKKARNDVYICFDEWNVWYHKRYQEKDALKTWDWPEAPSLLEEDYNFEDALLVAALINEFIRNADRVKIACIAQLINVIAPIRAERGGPAWRQSIYWPYQLASLYGRGEALQVALDSPTYDTRVADDVTYIDMSVTREVETGIVTAFIVNRHLTDTAAFSMDLCGFDPTRIVMHQVMEGHDLRATNSAAEPNRIAPVQGEGAVIEDGKLKARLGPLSYHVIRVEVC
ncbi:alpha-N-arabinofuranosidase [Ochrobactrum daejeonense]|uniref:non-reducing end alpha-L-arabinofuranosidase n=1 Tax=Brucella daejeonensis TaxID=659015 RepID=A0A7W9EKG3_9HYPH|nr:alpha-N-arabinofuranosidase [Brucella daejeonensis]MBB5701263.1 alpha-N-arabinofuranosidase [Brucella daejeonensis]